MITHLWEVGYLVNPEDPNSEAGLIIEIMGVDWDKREFRESIQGHIKSEVISKAMNFIIDHYKPLEKYIVKQ